MSESSSKEWKIGCAFHSLLVNIGGDKIQQAPCKLCKISGMVTFSSRGDEVNGLPRRPRGFLSELFSKSERPKCLDMVRLRIGANFSFMEQQILQGLYTDGAHHKQDTLSEILGMIRSPEEVQMLKDQYGDWSDD